MKHRTSTVEKCSCGSDDDGLLERLGEIILSYKGKPGALIPVLQITQDLFGYIPQEAIHLIADALHEPLSKVFGVITFYSFFSLKPRGKYLIRVCLGTACYVQGAGEVVTALKHQLDIDVGGTTEDRLFTLEVGRCFGACGLAPIIMINEDVHPWVKSPDVEKILKRYRKRNVEAKKETV